MNIDVSIIIVNYNAFSYLLKCIDSIFAFTKEVNYEVIIVDNNSTDGDISELLKEYDGINIIKNSENKGFAKANNQALKHAKGKYILFLNNDTKLIGNTIKNVYDYAENINMDIFIGCQLLNGDESNQESVIEFPTLWNSITENFFLYKIFPKSKLFNKYHQNFNTNSTPMKVDVIKGAFMFCTNAAVQNLNGFDDRFYFYSEETDLCYRFSKYDNSEIVFLPNEKVYHYGGLITNKNMWFMLKNLSIGKIQYYQKHFSTLSFYLVLVSHYLGIFFRSILYIVFGILMFDKSFFNKSKLFFKTLFIYPKNKFR